MGVEALEAPTRPAYATGGLRQIAALDELLSAGGIGKVRSGDLPRVEGRLEPTDATQGLDPADLLSEARVDEPEQGGHRGAVLEVRSVLDDHCGAARSPHHDAEATGWLAPEEISDLVDLLGRRGRQAHRRQKARVESTRWTKPCWLPAAACCVLVGAVVVVVVVVGSRAMAEGATGFVRPGSPG